MDNPWTSPWDTTGDASSVDDVVPEPRLPYDATQVKIPTPSPWADDDGFGDWVDGNAVATSAWDTANTAQATTQASGPEKPVASEESTLFHWRDEDRGYEVASDPWGTAATQNAWGEAANETPAETPADPDIVEAAASSDGDASSVRSRDTVETNGEHADDVYGSSTTAGGHSEDEAQESPGKKEDEPAEAAAKSRVHELVVMYDGMSRRKPEPVVRNETGDEAAKPSPPVVNEVLDETGRPRSASEDETTTQTFPPAICPPESDSDQAWESVDKDKSERPPAYPVDLSRLDDLFPGVPDSSTEPYEIPNQIERDTFASISERKMWYRVSRMGSLRRHDMGDDENYVRVSWAGSTIRSDVTKIVRRWMEHGTASAPAAGGRSGVGVFQWDSTAAPVPISELFPTRKPESAAQKPEPSKAAATKQVPVAASFGWSAPATAQAETVVGSGRGHGALGGHSSGVKMGHGTPTSAETSDGDRNPSDEDEEWGDMVEASDAKDVQASTVPPAAFEEWGKPGVKKQSTKLDAVRDQSSSAVLHKAGAAATAARPRHTAEERKDAVALEDIPLSEAKPRTGSVHFQTPTSRDDTGQLDKEAERRALDIINGLPDLSYMLD